MLDHCTNPYGRLCTFVGLNPTIKKLLSLFSEQECLRLGFLVKDDNQTLGVTIVGTGFLLDIEAGDVTTLHEAYAAGFEQGQAQAN